MFSTGFSSGERDGSRIRGQVVRDRELFGGVPAGAVEEQDGVGAAGDGSADLVEMGLHGLGVGEGHGEGRADAARRADGAEQIGALVALVGRLPGPGAAPGPLADETVLLADASLVLEPHLDRLALCNVGEMRLQRRRKVFLNAAMVSAFWPGWRGRALMCEKPSCFRSLPIVRS